MKDYFLRDGEEQNSSKIRYNSDQNTSIDPPSSFAFAVNTSSNKKKSLRIYAMNSFSLNVTKALKSTTFT